jgi:hypothetical protein
MVQQREALAVGGSDIDPWHLGEDLNDATGTDARRDGGVQRCVSMGILPAGRPVVTQQLLPLGSGCISDPGIS